MSLLLATTFVSPAVLAEVVDIKITSLSKLQSPLNYPDARATQLAVNNLVDGIREAAAEYFFQNVKGNFDKFQLYATTDFPSRRIMYLNLELQMEPGFTLKNGTTKLTRKFRINLFNDGECLTLDSVARLWEKAPAFTTSAACEAESKPEAGIYYTWIYAPLKDSLNGVCEERDPHTNTWASTPKSRRLGKFSCEQEMMKASDGWRWFSAVPELATGFDLRGFSHDFQEQLPQLPSTMKGLLSSLKIPAGYRMEFYPEEKFQGSPSAANGPSIYSNTAFVGATKSIKVVKSPLNPEIIPPVTPATVVYRVRFRGGYDGRVTVSYTMPDGSLAKDQATVVTGAGYVLRVPYNSTDMRFSAYSITGLVWAPTKVIFAKRASPTDRSFCAVTKGTSLKPTWYEESCKN